MRTGETLACLRTSHEHFAQFFGDGHPAVVLGLAVMAWSVRFVNGKYGGQGLILLSIALLL